MTIITAKITSTPHLTGITIHEVALVLASVLDTTVFMTTHIMVTVIIIPFTGILIMQDLIFSDTDFILSSTIASLSESEVVMLLPTSEEAIHKFVAQEPVVWTAEAAAYEQTGETEFGRLLELETEEVLLLQEEEGPREWNAPAVRAEHEVAPLNAREEARDVPVQLSDQEAAAILKEAPLNVRQGLQGVRGRLSGQEVAAGRKTVR